MTNTRPKANQLFLKAAELMPGGVNSPARAFRSVDLTPVFAEAGEGAYLTDVDGNRYIDYILSWGPLILGHRHPAVVKQLSETLMKGTSFGLPTEKENQLAQAVIERVPSMEMVRMVNSGTEATMSALRLARGVTNRNKILKFEGCYHGHGDSLLIKAGSGVATLGLPDSPGVTDALAKDTITVPYNDIESVKLAFKEYGNELACVIVEPVAGNMGVVPPVAGFLETLRELTEDYGSLLIFDEVMTGFRVGYYGAQGHFGVTPDLTCLGKVIGGGLPVGCYGGKKIYMSEIAPSGNIYQAGTLSGNPLAMTAGLSTLDNLTETSYQQLNERLNQLKQGFLEKKEQYNIPLQVNVAGSMIGIYFSDTPVYNYETAKNSRHDLFNHYYQTMLTEGILLPPSPYEGVFLSTAHTKADIDRTIEAIDVSFKALQAHV
ncbi:glutamate-1-semialdehyde 2,1-aminomutase [Halolactibacillus halophilus]|uniref:Glutamate-1-semialdehyde 2,1-aminomutase n=1 Tax=Halolactibacillus halophilus TaxID=306540 RepID=A0A1I5L1T7_9BACI|nr:glutamate-1-semialdehyde 2,1-aminomutase [Halolactibacillus halophilus]GEM00605.1 glutamate-1-semialdehyde 2,1-aminomutase 1 [Halolactibacillus halophilus]SFO91133.1 glutamate-1-semialdehyde 2,1-aminomutase [Halolactibacillus halophilus]